MAQHKNKSPKAPPREAVTPFAGEENFVVPKKGGFGQPDNEHYVMVAGSGSVAVPDAPTQTPASTETTTSTGIPVAPVGTQVGTTPTPAPDPTTQVDAPVTTPAPAPAPTTTTATPDVKPQAQIDCESAGGVYLNGVCNVATRTDLVFPDFSTLDCATLKAQIDSINSTLATSRFPIEIATQYTNALTSAKANYERKCPVAPPTPVTPPVPVIPVLPIGGFGGGIGGGGFGEPPAEDVVAEEPKKSNAGLVIVLVGIGILYFLTRKRN